MTGGSKPSPDREPYAPRHAPKRTTASGRAAASTGPGSARSAKASTGPKKKSFLRRKWWLLLLLTPLVVMALAGIGLYVAYARITLPETLPPIQTTYLYDRNGHLLTTLHGAVDRTLVPLSQISPHMIDAVIATEDHDFYNHPGVDVGGILRAAYTDVVKRSTVQGASTLTEQLVKNVYAGSYSTDANGVQTYVLPQRSVPEKIREALLAVKLEQQLGKDQILETYLNTVYFGHGAYGVEAAARTYFGKHASQLTILESASLAGVLHAPELYDPMDRPSDNWYRRNYAIEQMVQYGYLQKAEGDRLEKHRVLRHDRRSAGPPGRARPVGVLRLLRPQAAVRPLRRGRRVLGRHARDDDPGSQPAAGGRARDRRRAPGRRQRSRGRARVDRTQTGEILAMAGGRDWSTNKVNYATGAGGSGRQAGSAFKAFTLAAAMQQGYDLHKYWNGPSTIGVPQCPDATQPDGIWHPVNAGDGEAGTFTLAGATAHSVNTVFAQLIAQLGPAPVVDMAHALGIRSDLPEVCAITLGSVAVNPLEMTNAYATIADQGERHWATPLLQVKTDGQIDDTVTSPGEPELDANDANLVTYALQGVVREGTGTAAALSGFPVAGKTGTANENVDAWFCGYTVQIATCVWMGYPQGEIPLENVEGVPSVYGGTIPAAIWHDFMTIAMEGQTPESFPVPSFDGHSVGPSVVVSSPTPSPIPSATPSETPSPTPKPTHTPSPTPSPTTTPSPTSSPSPTASPP